MATVRVVRCTTYQCPNPPTSEYHYWGDIQPLGCREMHRVEVVWELCDECLAFAEEVIDSVCTLDEEGWEEWIVQ